MPLSHYTVKVTNIKLSKSQIFLHNSWVLCYSSCETSTSCTVSEVKWFI